MLVLMFLGTGYVMWTASCFDWDSELSDPYLYGTVLNSLNMIFFAWSAGKAYQSAGADEIKKVKWS